MSSWPPARVEGGVRAAARGDISVESVEPRESGKLFQIVQIIFDFTATSYSGDTPVQCFFSTFSYPSHAKHLVLIVFLEDCLPEMLSKLGVLAETSMNK